MFRFDWIVTLLFAVSSVEAISVLSIKGSKFFNAEGEQVFFKGKIYSVSGWREQC